MPPEVKARKEAILALAQNRQAAEGGAA
jgi:hypothetical protein